MSQTTIYHNPGCSKSRQTLSLLQDRGIEFDVVEYLNDPPNETTLIQILEKLAIEPRELIRDKEYRQLNLPDTQVREQLIALMAAHPQIIERPIVVVGPRARLGRPPETVLEILD